MATIPDGAACYFCLGEEEDEEGKPLVRDCSCRGDSAGFAHLSCLTKYAEQKCKQASDGAVIDFREPWQTCNNCKQQFQGQLSLDMASAFVSFAETTYGHPDNNKWDKMKIMESLRLKLARLSVADKPRIEKSELVNSLLAMVDQTKKALNMNRWIHMPKASEEYAYYRMLCGNYEAFAYSQLGGMLMLDSSEEGFKIMITHYKKARDIYNLVHMKDSAQRMDTVISVLTAEKQGANDEDAITNSALQAMKKMYELTLHTKGMDSEDTIRSGLFYAKRLRDANHCIEAERLVTQLATISRRVHGPDHKTTTELVELLKKRKERIITVFLENKQFQALRYDNDGEICVVTGPITKPRKVDDERTHRVESNLIVPGYGCAVICHGLVSASHLNGELGEVKDLKQIETGIRLAVHFEKKGAKSAL